MRTAAAERDSQARTQNEAPGYFSFELLCSLTWKMVPFWWVGFVAELGKLTENYVYCTPLTTSSRCFLLRITAEIGVFFTHGVLNSDLTEWYNFSIQTAQIEQTFQRTIPRRLILGDVAPFPLIPRYPPLSLLHTPCNSECTAAAAAAADGMR